MTHAPSPARPSRLAALLQHPGLWIFLLALAARFFVLLRFADSPFFEAQSGDSKFYHEWALRILHGQWTDHHAFYGLPGYAYLLAGIYALFGVDPFIPAALQAVAEALTAVLACTFARRMVLAELKPGDDARAADLVGAAAGLAWIFFVPAQTFSVILMPTALLVAAYWGGLWLILRLRESAATWAWGALGVGIGAVAMLVATVLFLLPLALVGALRRRVAVPRPQRILAASLAVAGVFLGCAPAWVHNAFIAHEPVMLSAHGGINFWIGNHPAANGYPKIPEGLRSGQQELLDDSISVAERETGHPLTRPEVSRYWSQKAWSEIRGNVLRWGHLLLWKLQAFWSPAVYDDLTAIALLRQEGLILPGLSFGLASAFGLLGLVLGVRRNELSRWVAAAVLLHMLAILPVFVTERYRLAAAPGLLALAAYAFWKVYLWWRAGAWQPLAGCFACLGLWWVLVARVDRTGQQEGSMQPYNLALSELEALDPLRRGASSDPARFEREHERLLAQISAHLEQVEKLAPRNPRLHFAYGRYWTERGDLPKAAASYRTALELDPRYSDALVNLALVEMQQQHWPEAAAVLTQVTALFPREAGYFYLLAQAQAGISDREKARTSIAEALRLAPGNETFLRFQKSVEK